MAGWRGALYELNWAGPAGLFGLKYDPILILDRVKKTHGFTGSGSGSAFPDPCPRTRRV